MGRYLSFVLACFLIASFAPPAEGTFVLAELETGGMHLEFPSGHGGLGVGAPGLSIFANAGTKDATSYPLIQCGPCAPGDVVSFSGNWLGTDGSVTYQGTQYFTSEPFHINEFHVTTPTIVVPPLGDPFTIVLPFTLTYGASFSDEQFAVNAFGAGFATVQFEPFPTTAWLTTEADYRIAPEPATCLLVASGVLIAAAVRPWRCHFHA